jgi:hypothetical protein
MRTAAKIRLSINFSACATVLTTPQLVAQQQSLTMPQNE